MRQTTLFFHPFINGARVSRATFAFEPIFGENNKFEGILASHSLCSNSDQFSRAKGREVALSKTPTALKVRDIPKYVGDTLNKHQKSENPLEYSDFYFLCLSFVE